MKKELSLSLDLRSKVLQGKGFEHETGFPTANILLPIVLKPGLYMAQSKCGPAIIWPKKKSLEEKYHAFAYFLSLPPHMNLRNRYVTFRQIRLVNFQRTSEFIQYICDTFCTCEPYDKEINHELIQQIFESA